MARSFASIGVLSFQKCRLPGIRLIDLDLPMSPNGNFFHLNQVQLEKPSSEAGLVSRPVRIHPCQEAAEVPFY